MKFLETHRTEHGTDNLQHLLDAIPYARFLNIEIDRKGNELTMMLPFDDHLIGNQKLPALHGGVLGSFLEITSVVQLLFNTSLETLPKTIDLSVDYLRSGKPIATYGRASVTRLGRRVANVRIEVWQEEVARPIAASHGHFLLAPT